MTWLEVSLDTTGEAVDWARTMLGGLGFVERLRITRYQHEPAERQDEGAGDDETPPWEFTIAFALPDDAQARPRLDELTRIFSSLQRAGMVGAPRLDAAQEQARQAEGFGAAGHRIGRRFVLLPVDESGAELAPHAAASLAETDLPIWLAPSLSFGSGLHPATVLCLQLIEQYVAPPLHVLDLGCGSGILSIALARLGATVLAVDNDRVAVAAARDAVRHNGVEAQITAMEGSLAQGSQLGHWLNERSFEEVPSVDAGAGFDMIVANILARVHTLLAADYHATLRPGGRLITSGFTSDQEEGVLEALADAGFELVDSAWQGDWVALLHRRG